MMYRLNKNQVPDNMMGNLPRLIHLSLVVILEREMMAEKIGNYSKILIIQPQVSTMFKEIF